MSEWSAKTCSPRARSTISRREFIKRALGAAAAASGLSLSAGCSGLLNEGDGTLPATTEPPSTEISTSIQTCRPTTTPQETRPEPPSAPIIDPSNLATYTSDIYPFSVKYPAGWFIEGTKEPSSGTNLHFLSPSRYASMTARIRPTSNDHLTPEAVSKYIRNYRQKREARTVEVVKRQDTTLPNSYRATRVDFLVAYSSHESIWINVVLPVVNRIHHLIEVNVNERVYTSTVKQGVTAILMSLTIDDSSSITVARRSTGERLFDRLP